VTSGESKGTRYKLQVTNRRLADALPDDGPIGLFGLLYTLPTYNPENGDQVNESYLVPCDLRLVVLVAAC